MIIDPDELYHVYPINDVHEHDLGYKYSDTGDLVHICKCQPVLKGADEGYPIVVHNSFDGREGIEWANEILSKS